MSVIGSREFKIIMSMEDKTKREREELDKYLGRLGTSADTLAGKLTVAAGALAATASLKMMADFGMNAVNAFAGAEASAQRLDAALAMRGMGSAKAGLNDLAASLQKVTGADGDLVIQLEAEMLAQGKSEAMIQKTIKAAAGLSAMTGKDLRASVESLNGTLAGAAREIGKMIPAVGNLTAEQLQAGGAIDIVAKQYGGFAGKTGTTQIAIASATESFNDLTESLGQGLAPVVSEGAMLLGSLASAAAAVPGPVKTIAGIVGVVLIGALAGLAIKTVAVTVATWGWFGAETAKAAAIAATNPLVWAGVAAAIATATAVGLLVAAKIREANASKEAAAATANNTGIMSTANIAAGNYNDTLQGLGDVELAAARASLYHAMSLSTSMDALTVANAKLRVIDDELKRRKDTGAKAAADLAAKASANFAGIMDDYKMKLLQQAGDRLGILDLERTQALAKLQEQLKDKAQLGAAIVEMEKFYGEERRRAIEEMNRNIITSTNGAARQARDESVGKAANMAAGIPTDTAQAAVSITQGGDLASMLGAAGGAGDPMGMMVGFISKMGNLLAIMNPLSTILGAVMDVLAPVVNNLLAPFVGILKILGMTLGKLLVPVLELLRPIIESVALAFIWLYNNAIMPVVNRVVSGLNIAFNAFAGFINGIIASIDGIPGVDIDYRIALKGANDGMLSAIDMTSLANAGTASSSGGGGGDGGGASYAAGTTVKIEKIEIKADFIAGDAGLMDIAIMIRDKIQEAERIGR